MHHYFKCLDPRAKRDLLPGQQARPSTGQCREGCVVQCWCPPFSTGKSHNIVLLSTSMQRRLSPSRPSLDTHATPVSIKRRLIILHVQRQKDRREVFKVTPVSPRVVIREAPSSQGETLEGSCTYIARIRADETKTTPPPTPGVSSLTTTRRNS